MRPSRCGAARTRRRGGLRLRRQPPRAGDLRWGGAEATPHPTAPHSRRWHPSAAPGRLRGRPESLQHHQRIHPDAHTGSNSTSVAWREASTHSRPGGLPGLRSAGGVAFTGGASRARASSPQAAGARRHSGHHLASWAAAILQQGGQQSRKPLPHTLQQRPTVRCRAPRRQSHRPQAQTPAARSPVAWFSKRGDKPCGNRRPETLGPGHQLA